MGSQQTPGLNSGWRFHGKYETDGLLSDMPVRTE